METLVFITQTHLKIPRASKKFYKPAEKSGLCVSNIVDGKTSQNKDPDLITIVS